MKTGFCFIIFIASSLCAPSEILTKDDVVKEGDSISIETSTSVITKHEVKTLPVYEKKLVNSSNSLKTCSPNCHLEILEKPLYLVLKSEALTEPNVIYLKDGLKGFQPSDKIKLSTTNGYSMVVLTKNDLPIKSFPRIVDMKPVESVPESNNIPYVVVANEKEMMDINRDEKYVKVAEVEVLSDGLIKGVKILKPVIKMDEKMSQELIERTIGYPTNLETLLPVNVNLPLSNFYGTLKSINENDRSILREDDMIQTPVPVHYVIRPQVKDPSEVYPTSVPVETQITMDELPKYYLGQLLQSQINPRRSNPLYLENFDYPEQKYKYIPIQIANNLNYIPRRENIAPNTVYSYFEMKPQRNISPPNLTPIHDSESSYKPHYYYGPSVMGVMQVPIKMPHHYPMYNQAYPYGSSSPGVTYVLNICQGHKPSESPVEPGKPVDPVEHIKPDQIILKPNEKPMHIESSKPFETESPSSVIHKEYVPEFYHRTVMNPSIDSDDERKIFIFKKPFAESRPSAVKPPNHSPPELPPIPDIRRPMPKLYPIGFLPNHN